MAGLIEMRVSTLSAVLCSLSFKASDVIFCAAATGIGTVFASGGLLAAAPSILEAWSWSLEEKTSQVHRPNCGSMI